MARINIESKWWADPRRTKLIEKIGRIALADGMMVTAWRLSQQYWKDNQHGIPEPIFMSLDGAQEILDCGLAKLSDDAEFIYVRGSTEHHEWLLEHVKKSKKAGKVSAASRSRNHKEKFQPNSTQLNQTQPSSSSSFSNSDSHSHTNSNSNITGSLPGESLLEDNSQSQDKSIKPHPSGGAVTPLPPPQDFFIEIKKQETKTINEDLRKLVAVYVESFQTVYGEHSRPDTGGKVIGQMKILLKDYPFDRVSELLQAYLQMDDPWFVKRCHDFSTIVNNINKVSVAFDTGRKPTKSGVDWEKLRRESEK